MRLFAGIIAAFLILSPQARAADKMTLAQCLGVLGSLNALDGRQVIVKEAGNERAVQQPYEFGNGAVRLAIARNIAALQVVQKAFNDARDKLIRDLGSNGQISADSPAFQKFSEEVGQMMAAEQSVDLVHIKASDLKLDRNEVPVSVLSGLLPIIDQ